jgi:hypothetical protein
MHNRVAHGTIRRVPMRVRALSVPISLAQKRSYYHAKPSRRLSKSRPHMVVPAFHTLVLQAG